MRIIDAHNHLFDEPGYVGKLLDTMDATGVERICVSGLGPLFGNVDNAAVKKTCDTYPDRIIGAVFVRPGADGPELVDWGYNEGFKMVKVTIPRTGYDDPAHFPLWDRACSYGMPVLFHTGVVVTAVEAPGQGISSWNMHPMRIEPITREFPDLSVIIAHLGVHWHDAAADLARMRPNVYVDLTGAPGGWRARADAVGVDTWLWWPRAFEKVVFGTDVHYTDMPEALRQDLARLDRFEIDSETRDLIFHGNIMRLIGE